MFSEMARYVVRVAVAAAVLVLAAPAVAAPAASGGSVMPWEACSPEEAGISSDALADMLERIEAEDLEVHGIVIVKDDRLVLEAYSHPYDRDTIHNVKSVSKSVISALVGIALREGLIGGLDETVYEHLPQYFADDPDGRKKTITLWHLLTMTSGLDLDENGPVSGQIFGTLDWLKATYGRPMRNDPGTVFCYSTPLTHTMSAVITEAGGVSLHEFAEKYLFGPLGFGEVQWTRGPQGYNFGGAELFMRPLDMAKFGYLFLKAGVWQGGQIVPAEWVAESTANRLVGVDDERLYGYWWWLDEKGYYYARGWGGQSIWVNPESNLVISVTAADFRSPGSLLSEYVMPWLETPQKLGPNPEGAERLARIAARIEHPVPEEVPALPAIAATITGKTFTMEWNATGIESMAIDFREDGTALLHLNTIAGDHDLAVGLDGVYRISETGTWGRMPVGNRRASRGYWADDSTFHISSREIGNPLYPEEDLIFTGDAIEVKTVLLPLGREIVIRGKAE